MQALLRKIRKILKDRRTRQFLARVVTSLAAIVVFVTTYALILPAITLEKTAVCGMEEHQHNDSCYKERLVCGLEESDGHHHDESCYATATILDCEVPEHRHSAENECYDVDGNLVCQLKEHVHDDSCYEEARTLTCGQEEQEGHRHTDACYEKVLVCGKDVHTHNTNCYEKDGRTDDAAYAYSVDKSSEPEGAGDTGNTENTTDTGETGKTGNITDSGDTGNIGNTVPGVSDSEAAEEETQSDHYVPELDPLDMEDMLNSHTDFYYFHAEEGEEVPDDNAEITDWRKVDKEKKLAPADLVRMYLAYTIPAGSLNETNPSARYRLPDNLHLSDEQIKAINRYENGIAAGYRDSGSPSEKGEKDKAKENYKKYLGAEAVEGSRRPDEQPENSGNEYISAVVRAENVYDDKGHYLGQDLIFTFVPYSIEKNQETYDADKTLISAGEKITGWFTCDFRLDQIDWEQEEAQEEADKEGDGIREASIEKTANVIFAPGSHNKGSEEISRVLRMTEESGEIRETGENEEIGEILETGETEETGEETGENGAIRDGASAGTKSDAQISTHVITADGNDYLITVTYGSEAEIPQGAELAVRELLPGTEEYDQHMQAVEEKIHSENPEDDSVSLAARFFDITILSDGVEVQPSAPVDVKIELTEKIGEDLQVFHFDDEGDKVETLQTVQPEQTEEQAPETRDSTVQFCTESFSVFAIVGTVIEKNVLASDGKNYKVTVTYGTDANLPDDVDLDVSELSQDDEMYAQYLEESAAKLGRDADSISYARIFDISLISESDSDIHYQPEANVSVSIELIDAADSQIESLKVLHISDGFVEIMNTTSNGSTLNFQTDSFSIYPIVDDDTPGGNARIAYRFWYFNAASGNYEQMSTQYFRYSDVQEQDAEIYEPSIPGMSQEDFVRIFRGWHKGTVNGNTANLSEESVTVLELNQELKAKTEDQFVEGTTIDLIAELKDAYYITYVDINTNNILSTDLVLKEEGETYFTVKDLVKPTRYEDKLMGWRLLEDIDDPDALLYEAGTQYTISENITLAPVVEGGYWLVFDDNDLVDDGTGRMVSGGASYTAPAFYMNTESEKEVTVQPEDPTRTGYAFGGWYEDEACTIPFTFGELLTKNTTVYAKWIPSDSAYRVIIWKQKSTDKVGIDDEAKTYDYDTSFLIETDVTTGDLIYLDNQYANIYGENGTSLDTDKAYFTYNPDKSDPYIVVKADGSSVINVYYDRVPMAMNFYTWGNGYIYTETTSESGTLYGLVNGEYVLLNHEDGEDIYTYTYSPVYSATTGDNGTQYGIVNGEYVELDKQSVTTYRPYYIYNPATGTGGTQYGVYNGEFVQLYYNRGTWYRTRTGFINYTYSNPFYGNRYTRTRNNNGAYTFTDTRYTRTGNSAPYTYTETTSDSGTQYGEVTPDRGHVELEKNVSGYIYYYNGERFTGTRYTASTAPAAYDGQRYRKDGDVYHATDEDGQGLYGRDQNNIFRLLNETHTPAKLWSYTDSDGVKHYYSGTRYTRSNNQQNSWQLYRSYEGLYGSTLESNGYTWPTGYNWYDRGYNIANGGNTNGGTAGATGGSRMTLKTTFEPLDNSTTANFYGGNETTTGAAIIFYLQNLDGTYSEANRFYTGNNSGSFRINDKYTGFHAAQYRAGGSGNWTAVTPKGADGYYGSAISFNNRFEVRFDRNEYTLTFFTNNGGNDVVDYTVLYEDDISAYADQAEGQKTGYYFLGWFADDGFSQPFDFNTVMPDHNLDVYGYWRMERIRVVIVPGANNVYTGSQALNFRLDYDEKIGGSMLEAATRTGYILDGWYTDPEFTNKWIFSTPVNATVEGVDMTYHTSPKWASARVAYGDDDEEHSNVRGIIQLYAKWIVDTSKKGINVEYDPGDAGLYDTNGTSLTTVPIDPQLYQEGSDVIVGPAPSGYNELYHFLYWEPIDSEGNVLEVTDRDGNRITQLSPGTAFNVDGVTPYSHTEDEDGNPVLKTIRLRAKYVKNEDVDGRYTTITYNGNSFDAEVYPDGTELMQGRTSDGSNQVQVTYDQQINETIVLPGKDDFYLDGYELVGWSFIEGSYEDQTDPVKLDGNVNFLPGQKVAADDLFQNSLNDESNILYAMWQPKLYSVTLKQVIESGVTQTSFNYRWKIGVEKYLLHNYATGEVTLTGNDSFIFGEIFYYYGRHGDVINITDPQIPDSANYTVRVNAVVTRDDGTKETLPLNELGNYEILGDVEITYTYSLKVPVKLEKKSLIDESYLNGSNFLLTPVEWNSETQRWETSGQLTFEYDMTSASSLTLNLQEGTYKVTEETAPENYAKMSEPLLLTVRKDRAFTLRTMAGNNVSDSIAEITGTDSHTLTVYDRPLRTITIEKAVEGVDLETDGYVFDTRLTLDGSPLVTYDTGGQGLAQDTTNAAGVIQYRIKAGESRTLRIPWGTEVTVEEKEYELYSVETYAESGIEDLDPENDRIFKCEIQENDTVTFKNTIKAVSIKLIKVGVNNMDEETVERPLPGAVLTIYTSQGGSEVAKDAEGNNLQNLIASSEQGKEGVFFEGMLNPGTYYLEEITVPDGYIGPLGRFELTVSAEEAPVVKGTWMSGDPDDVQGIVTGNLTEGFTVTFRNTAGYVLPSTGGRGTGRIYLPGLMLIGLAGAGLVMRKRRREA